MKEFNDLHHWSEQPACRADILDAQKRKKIKNTFKAAKASPFETWEFCNSLAASSPPGVGTCRRIITGKCWMVIVHTHDHWLCKRFRS